MKVYYIIPQNGQNGLRIIYTPDYREDLVQEDQIIEDKIHNMLRNTISLNQCIMIGFVITINIGISQYFMLESILSKFSNDIINNIVFLFPDSTLDNPTQKDILLSKTHLINEIQSPVINMIPTMINSWYLKFNISTLYIQNNNTNQQENKQLWEMGKKSFQQLIHKQLQYKINLKNSDQMRNYYYNLFLRTFNTCVNASELAQSRQRCINQFNILYKRETFGYQKQNEYLERQTQNLNTRIKSDFTSNQHPNAWMSLSESYYYELRNADQHFDQTNNFYQSLPEQIYKNYDLLYSYIKLIQDKSEYNKGFEEFYNYFKQYINDMQKYLIKILSDHTLHFQFNSILISINPCQYQYYDHLIKQEEKYKQEDWSKRCQILKKRYNFFIQTFDYIKGSKQLLCQKWKDYQFKRERHPDAPDWCKDGAIVYLQWKNLFEKDGQWKLHLYKSGNPQEISDLSSRSDKQDYTEFIQPRISDDCNKHFQEYFNYYLPHWE